MNLFEKIFNYQVLSRLEDSGTTMITAQEKSWLKTMLAYPAASIAFDKDALHKLNSLLGQEKDLDITDHLIEKARSSDVQVYHPLLRQLRRTIMSKAGMRISYFGKDGHVGAEHSGMPYKLEYSMVKREWYLLWLHLRNQTFMSTKLQKIAAIAEMTLLQEDYEYYQRKVAKILESRKKEAVVEVVPAYNQELSRILYALSCFEKDVAFAIESGIYQVRICYLADESEYLLSKLRFLGKRVRVIEGSGLMARMQESSANALARYGEIPADQQEKPLSS